jgi:hypothetical protein
MASTTGRWSLSVVISAQEAGAPRLNAATTGLSRHLAAAAERSQTSAKKRISHRPGPVDRGFLPRGLSYASRRPKLFTKAEWRVPRPWSEKLPFPNLGLAVVPDPTKPLENRAADPESSQSPALVGSDSAPFAAYTRSVDSALRDFDWPHHGADSLCQPGARPCSPAVQPNPLKAPAAEVAFAIGRKFRR